MGHSILQMFTTLGSITRPDNFKLDNLSRKSNVIEKIVSYLYFLPNDMIGGVKKTFLVFMLRCKIHYQILNYQDLFGSLS